MLEYSRLSGPAAEVSDPADVVEFYSHSGPHGIYLSNEVGAAHNLAYGRTFLNDAGDHRFDSTPYEDAFTNLSPDAMINLYGCKMGTAKHGRPAGAQELADATGATVTGYESGTFFTNDIELGSGARARRISDFSETISGAEPVWMVPSAAGGEWKTFYPAGGDPNGLPPAAGPPRPTGDVELDEMLENLSLPTASPESATPAAGSILAEYGDWLEMKEKQDAWLEQLETQQKDWHESAHERYRTSLADLFDETQDWLNRQLPEWEEAATPDQQNLLVELGEWLEKEVDNQRGSMEQLLAQEQAWRQQHSDSEVGLLREFWEYRQNWVEEAAPMSPEATHGLLADFGEWIDNEQGNQGAYLAQERHDLDGWHQKQEHETAQVLQTLQDSLQEHVQYALSTDTFAPQFDAQNIFQTQITELFSHHADNSYNNFHHEQNNFDSGWANQFNQWEGGAQQVQNQLSQQF